jgi:hypothetical protein
MFGNFPKILKILVANSKFAGHVNLNGRLRQSSTNLNVYLLARDLKRRSDVPKVFFEARVFGNCGYVGMANTIVCDSDFIPEFLVEHRIEFSDGRVHGAGWTYRDAFVAWILGHELGHVTAGAAGGHFGEANVLEQKIDASVAMSQKLETEADLFAAKRVEANGKLKDALESVLLALINSEIEVKNGTSPAYGVGLHWDYADKAVIAYFANTDHPEYVVRATRMLAFLARDTHEEGLQALVESFARHLVQVSDNPH